MSSATSASRGAGPGKCGRGAASQPEGHSVLGATWAQRQEPRREAAAAARSGLLSAPWVPVLVRSGGTSPLLAVLLLNFAASLPHVISRMGRLEQVDVNLFCLVATDFYRHQIEEELDRRAFQSVFEVVASPGNPYHRLLACLHSVHSVAAC